MKTREWFDVGCKLLGIYLLILSLQGMGNALFVSFGPTHNAGMGTEYANIAKYIGWLAPVIHLVVGLYMLRSGRLIRKFAFPDESGDSDFSNSSVLPLAFKIIGLYLIVSDCPWVTWPIARYLVVKDTRTFLQFLGDGLSQFSFFVAVIKIVLGLYLLRDGNLFLRFAHPVPRGSPWDRESDE